MIMPFDTDDTFGDLNVSGGLAATIAAGRSLDLVGTMGKGTSGLATGVISLVSLADNYIKPAFVRAGWSVTGGVDLTWDGSRYRFRIPVWVLSKHSDEEVRNNARAVLLGIRQGALGLQTFSDVNVGLERQNTTVNPNSGGGGVGTTANSFDPFASLPLPSVLNNALTPVAVALGVSGGTVLVVGGALLVLLLRRR